MKTIIITGGSKGVGLELSRLLNKDEYEVISLSRSFEEKMVCENGIYKLKCDIEDINSINFAFEEIYDKFSRVDFLINCAGSGVMSSIEDLSIEDVTHQLNAGILGPIAIIQKVLPLMYASKSGKIVNVTASGGRAYFPGLPIYVASKLALDYLSEQLYREVGAFGLSVSVVELGPIKSNFGKSIKRPETNNSKYNSYYKKVSNGYYNMFKSRSRSSNYAAKLIYKAMLGTKFRYQSSIYDMLWIFASQILPINWYRKLINLRFK